MSQIAKLVNFEIVQEISIFPTNAVLLGPANWTVRRKRPGQVKAVNIPQLLKLQNLWPVHLTNSQTNLWCCRFYFLILFVFAKVFAFIYEISRII